MKTKHRNPVMLPILMSICFFILNSNNLYAQKSPCPCDMETAKVLAKAYVLSIPLNEKENFPELVNLLLNYDNFFDENSKLIKCADLLGNMLIRYALQNYSHDNPQESRERMFNIGANAGVPPEITSKACDDMTTSNASLEMFELGRELLWLVEVLPPACQGNDEPYFSTGTENRQLIRQFAPIFAGMGQEMEAYFNAVLRENQSTFFSMMEEQLLIYSLMACSVR